MRTKSLVLAFLVSLTLLLAACGDRDRHTIDPLTGGHIQQGIAAISRYGCGTCHIIPGIPGAAGRAGPSLAGMGSRIYVAGMLQNTPPNMVRWLENPQAINAKTVMPNMGVTPKDATDIASYLYTLK
jgi:cytochrome c